MITIKGSTRRKHAKEEVSQTIELQPNYKDRNEQNIVLLKRATVLSHTKQLSVKVLL
jgi:hypothetical protein